MCVVLFDLLLSPFGRWLVGFRATTLVPAVDDINCSGSEATMGSNYKVDPIHFFHLSLIHNMDVQIIINY